jgi:hypothetical protein
MPQEQAQKHSQSVDQRSGKTHEESKTAHGELQKKKS